MDIEGFVPKDKFDTDALIGIPEVPVSALEPVLAKMLTWLQDPMWPVFNLVAEYLCHYTNEISKYLVEILRGNDDIWSYMCIDALVINSKHSVENQELICIVRRIAAADEDDYPDAGLITKAKEAVVMFEAYSQIDKK